MRARLSMVIALMVLGPLSGRPAEAQPVGSFMVADGPSFEVNPPVYSCLETCALLFGGAADDYSCSTSDTMIDHQAWLDGWGDGFSYCSDTPGPEDFVQGTTYDCGSVGCSYSAYVADHFCMMPNYCWAQETPPGGECGDGTVDAGEACDDGNVADGDCCSASCQLEGVGASCGDGDACNGDEVCDGAGACVAGDAPVCDDGDPCTQDACDPIGGCMVDTGPAVECTEANWAALEVDPWKRGLGFAWSGSADVEEFGNPTAADGDTTAMCIYNESGALVGSLAVDPGGKCGRQPCWKSSSGGFTYTNLFGNEDGVRAVSLKAGSAGRARIGLVAWGRSFSDVDRGKPIVAQVVNSAGGCFEATFEGRDHRMCRGWKKHHHWRPSHSSHHHRR
jgi:cysteine-rich repeat protein